MFPASEGPPHQLSGRCIRRLRFRRNNDTRIGALGVALGHRRRAPLGAAYHRRVRLRACAPWSISDAAGLVIITAVPAGVPSEAWYLHWFALRIGSRRMAWMCALGCNQRMCRDVVRSLHGATRRNGHLLYNSVIL